MSRIPFIGLWMSASIKRTFHMLPANAKRMSAVEDAAEKPQEGHAHSSGAMAEYGSNFLMDSIFS
ncbi:hypothetical protein PZN02_000094 [Sinorhizobium garamanticum]|uniref:Uncharacterized protein n=1 Tax=Sinorhizobium garamanticum TaxID=680247 RepID=A0ABY8DHY1_9HYPH|nr:hypothetical protein [Sinorhizobium garamanticum]WEX89607.1 hypothetical protein PZN02_000094 [Sinorhizobium garamanticum]